MKKILSYAALSVLSMMFLAGSARAAILATAVREAFAVNPNGTPTFIPLDEAGNTTISFSTASTQKIAVLFNADCAVNTAGDFVFVEIYVDNVLASGTSASPSILCSQTTLAAHERNVFATVSSGNHTVKVSSYTVNSVGGAGGTAKLRRLVTLVTN